MASSKKYLCQPCRPERERKSRCLCFDCKELLCEECSKWHMKFEISRDHTLIDLVPYFEKWKQSETTNTTDLTTSEREFIMNIKLSSDTTLYRPAQVAIQKEKRKEVKSTKCLEFCVNDVTKKEIDGLIGAICVEENIVVFDLNNLNLFDCHGNFLSSSNTKAETRCITPVSNSSFATSGYGSRVYFWKVQGKSIVAESVSYKVEHVAHGIHFNGTYLSVLHSVNNSITILEKDGKVVDKIVKEKAMGKRIKFGWDLHMDRETNNIYLPLDTEDGVLCLSLEGEVLWFTPLDSVRGITEIEGELCVADVQNACLHLMTKKGEYVRKLLDEKNLKGTPYAVSFAANNRLYVTFEAPVERRNTIIIFAVALEK